MAHDARKGVLHEILYPDDLVLPSKTIDLQRKFSLLKATLESKGMKVNINKINGEWNKRGNMKK